MSGRSILNLLPRSVPEVQIRRLSLCSSISKQPALEASPRRHFASLRRRRKYVGKIVDPLLHSTSPTTFGKMEEPYEHGEASMEEYLKKTSLSPWVPLSDATARKILDLARVGPEDIHVDLGSGDGRVNFHAIDYGVEKSTGIDIDENIVQVARDRMAKRHPPPKLEFIVADLLDESHPAWEKVQEATIITMYFAKEALALFRPVLERKLVGKECKIVTAGYEMPGWESHSQEVVLGTQIHLYEWGKEDADDFFFHEDILQQKPDEMMGNPLEADKFRGANITDHTRKFPIRGFNPEIFTNKEYYDDDEDWDASSSDDEDESEDEGGTDAKKKQGVRLLLKREEEKKTRSLEGERLVNLLTV